MDVVLGIASSIATILGLLLTIYSMAFPNQLNEMTGRFLGPTEADGKIRAEFVAGQLTLFLITLGISSVAIGLGIAGLWNWLSALKASAIAAGRDMRNWYWTFIVFAFLCISLGIYLPKAIFVPTNPLELQRQFPPAAWALRSPLGGMLLGLGMIVASALVAWAIYGIGLFLRNLKGKQYQRIMENG
jgi:hypothetical protein